MQEMRRKQDEARQRELEERRRKEAEAKRQRLEDAERKRLAMQEAIKRRDEEAKRNFVVPKRTNGSIPTNAGPMIVGMRDGGSMMLVQMSRYKLNNGECNCNFTAILTVLDAFYFVFYVLIAHSILSL